MSPLASAKVNIALKTTQITLAKLTAANFTLANFTLANFTFVTSRSQLHVLKFTVAKFRPG